MLEVVFTGPAGVDAEDATWTEQLHTLGDAILAWTGNHASVIDFAEQDVGRMRKENPPVLQSLRRDGIDLAETPLHALLGRA